MEIVHRNKCYHFHKEVSVVCRGVKITAPHKTHVALVKHPNY